MINIYVGNLPYGTDDAELEQMFAAHGDVSQAKVITDRATGRSRGFGFVEMSNDEQAHAAIEAMSEMEMDGRKLTVNEAKPRN